MKIKSRHKLIPAIAMVLVSAVVLSSASYAWFTMSRTVTAEGIKLTAVAPTNLLIANENVEASYGEKTTVSEVFSGKLIPASSADGIKFFAPKEIKKDNNGAPNATTKIEAVTKALAKDDVDPDTKDEENEGYYADFKLWLKTTGEKAVNVTVNADALITKIVNGDAVTDPVKSINDAVRFAILDANGTAIPANTATTKAGNNTYSLMGGKISEQTKFAGILGPMKSTTDWNGAPGEPAGINSGDSQFNVAANGTPTQITVRVWIEGQAAACINNAAKANFTLNIGFKDVDFVETVVTP